MADLNFRSVGLGYIGSPYHIIDTSIAGILYAVVNVAKGKGVHACLPVFICHAMYNSIAWAMKNL